MNKKITYIFIIVNILSLIGISFLDIDKNLINKLSIFLSASLSLLIGLVFGFKKGKNGLLWGIVIGISIATLSSIIHFITATQYFGPLYIRMGIIILSGSAGGVIGVNKKHP